ncbi:cytochrome C oxidase subunit IV family protein [Amycolatopsis sp. Poz14]|nr:cytochrome C oxidase subunit IV family protein [Amycolatopsis sp. Poz14]
MGERSSAGRNRVFLVWLGLIIVTCLSFWLGSGHGFSSATAANIAVVAVAFLKVRCIGLYFMELKDAPRRLRVIFESYCLGLCAVLIVLLAG